MSEGLFASVLMFLRKSVVIMSNKTACCSKISLKKVQLIEKEKVMVMLLFCLHDYTPSLTSL